MRGRTGVVVLLATLVATSCSWSQYAGNAGHTSWNRNDDTLTVANTDGISERWNAPMTTNLHPLSAIPILIDHGLVFVARKVPGYAGETLAAYDEKGMTSCTGDPETCTPEWVAPVDGVDGLGSAYDIAVADALIVVASHTHVTPCEGCPPLRSESVFGYDARGIEGCAGGAPRVCAPLVRFDSSAGTLTAAEGRLYVTPELGADEGMVVKVFDAAVVEGCTGVSGIPARSCAPIMTMPGRARASVDGGLVAAMDPASTRNIAIYDTHGPRCADGTCTKSLTLRAPSDFTEFTKHAAVTDGWVYATTYTSLVAWELRTCTTGSLCSPAWRATIPLSGAVPVPTVAAGKVFVTHQPDAEGENISVFDRAGGTGCAGSPKVCAPLWQATSFGTERMTATKHLLVTGGAALLAFDLGGEVGCGGVPKTCAPVWVEPRFAVNPSVASGQVLVNTDLAITAFGLPT